MLNLISCVLWSSPAHYAPSKNVSNEGDSILELFSGIGTTSTCALKLFRNTVALEKHDEQLSFFNMRIKALWECLDQDEEVGAKHIAEIERFQMSRELIPPLGDKPRELFDLDDDLREHLTIVSLSGVDTTATICEESSQMNEVDNDADTLIAM